MVSFNFQDGETVSSPTTIVSGSTTAIQRGLVTFTNNDSNVFPPQTFEVNLGHFKALLHVSPNEPNLFHVQVMANGSIDQAGFPQYGNAPPQIVDEGRLTLYYNPLPQNKPIHLCLVVANDSPGGYDMPSYKLNRGDKPSIEAAVRKLKIAGRIMQAYTQDEMRGHGFSNRTFPFVEESVKNLGVFGFADLEYPTPHLEVKVHVLRSHMSVAELRDPDIAQQNPHAKRNGLLFDHAIDLITRDPELGLVIRNSGSAIQCAAIYLDSTFDRKRDMILTHAALGGGNHEVKLAIFGSHGLHSWPNTFLEISPCFLDDTPLTKKEVANDANQCGTSWECLNITLGAFMHEIGHLLGCPHQVDGVMLRDYIRWNRAFMTRETKCLRENTLLAVISRDGTWDKTCHWNILDLIRFLYHGSFSLPIDRFSKAHSTIMNSASDEKTSPSVVHTGRRELMIKGDGIYMAELITDDLARHHTVFYPRDYQGQGETDTLTLDYDECYKNISSRHAKCPRNFQVRVLATSGELFFDDFYAATKASAETVRLPLASVPAVKSHLLGRSNKNPEFMVEFSLQDVTQVRVYHGGALDGIRFTLRNPEKKQLILKSFALSNSVLVGFETGGSSDWLVPNGEVIAKMYVRNGAWIDAIQFETDRGTVSPMFGNNGGHKSVLEVPHKEKAFLGMYGYKNQWLDGLGIMYEAA